MSGDGDNSSCIFLAVPQEPDKSAQHEVKDVTMGAPQSTDITCQVCFQNDESSPSTWSMISYDSTGQRKIKGGDEFYIRYEEFVDIGRNDNNCPEAVEDCKEKGVNQTLILQAVAVITDNNDGSYSLDFIQTPISHANGTVSLGEATEIISSSTAASSALTVYFEYSNGIGFMPPPTKNDWKNGGYTHKCYTVSPCPYRPVIRPFCPPSLSSLSNGDVNLKMFHKIFFFGDSTMDQFVRQRPNKKGKYYFQPNIKVGKKVRLGLNSETIDTLLDQLHNELGEEIVEASRQTQEEDDDDNEGRNAALVVGSCLWDILDPECTIQGKEYYDHLDACRLYVEGIQQRYPGVQVIWKLPYAVHIHVIDLQRLIDHDASTATLFGINRIRYMSASRSRFLYHRQKEVMEQLGVPMLDLFETTYLSADKLYPSDGRHYRPGE